MILKDILTASPYKSEQKVVWSKVWHFILELAYPMATKKIYNMRKQREGIEHIAQVKEINLLDIRTRLNAQISEGDEILELVGDPSVMKQLLEICPKFFSKPYVIARVEKGKSLNSYVFTTQLKIIKKSKNIALDADDIDYEKEGLLKDIASKSNILIIPHDGLSYSTDLPYPLLVLETDGDEFCIKYSSARSSYKMNKYQKPVNSRSEASVNERDIYSILHSKDSPYIALTNDHIDGCYYLYHDGKTIKKM